MKKILELSKSVSKHCVGFEGNVSSKYKNGLIIKASGTRLESLTKKDLVFFDFKGNQLNNFKKRGSMELSFHTYLLSFDDINYADLSRTASFPQGRHTNNLEYIANYTNDYTTYDRLQLMKMLLPYVVSIEKTQAEHIEQPLFPDIDTSDLIDKKEFDVRDLFRIDKYEQGTRTDLLSIVDKKLEQEKEQ